MAHRDMLDVIEDLKTAISTAYSLGPSVPTLVYNGLNTAWTELHNGYSTYPHVYVKLSSEPVVDASYSLALVRE